MPNTPLKAKTHQCQTVLHNTAKAVLNEQTGQNATPSVTDPAIMPPWKASNNKTDTQLKIIMKANDKKKNGKSPTMPETRKPKEPGQETKAGQRLPPSVTPRKMPPSTAVNRILAQAQGRYNGVHHPGKQQTPPHLKEEEG